MARRALGLTVKGIETLGPGYHADGGGLYLQVVGSGRSWIFRYQIAGKRRDMGLGSTRIVGLSEARRMAHECRRLLFEGIDPLDRKHGQRAAAAAERAKMVTFADAAEQYIAAHRVGWRGSRQANQWRHSMTTYAYPIIGNLPVQTIDVALVLKAIEPIWTEKPETASRVRSRIEAVLDWAAARGYRTGDNPARWKGHLENLLPKRSKVRKVEHLTALPYSAIGTFMAELRGQDGTASRALEFSILTASRRAEVVGARWDEIDLKERLWTVPAARMKANRQHRVPLTDAVIAILDGMPRKSDYVFAGKNGTKPIGQVSLWRALQAIRPNVTAHGFRSTFRDWAAERTNFPREVAELALAHSVGSEVERAYQRGDMFAKRAQIMDAWARFCDSPVASGEKVVNLRR
jgi:integrase